MPETAGMPSARARMAAWPVAAPVSVTMPAIQRLSIIDAWDGKISGMTRMIGLLDLERRRLRLVVRELGHDPADDVAQVGEASLEVGVGDLAEEGGVFLERLLQGGGGVDALLADAGENLADHGRVAEQLAVGAEDAGLLVADLPADADDGVVDLAGHGGAGPFETVDLPGQTRVVQGVRLVAGDDLLDAMGMRDGHTRRNGYALLHRPRLYRPGKPASGLPLLHFRTGLDRERKVEPPCYGMLYYRHRPRASGVCQLTHPHRPPS